MKKQSVNILGIEVILTLLSKKEMRGLPIGIIAEFYIYRGLFHNEKYIFYHSKTDKEFTPSVYAAYSEKINSVLSKPVILITNKGDYVNRMRLFEKGVYFVSSSKYAFLPNLVVNTTESTPKKKRTKQLSPKAQFLLLYWMQEQSLGTEVTITDFSNKWNFSYISIARALADLERFKVCDSTKNKDNSKTYHFRKDKRLMWNDCQDILRNPVLRTVYSDNPIPDIYRKTSISALSHYSLLNPENADTVAVLDTDFRESSWKEYTNEIEGKYRIEVWCYEPAMFANEKYVDRLSLVLSLRDNTDARVEGEVERIINEMQW